MVRLNLEELLLKNGRSKYWLVSQLESNYTVINRMINSQSEGIRFKTIDRLLEIFNCSIDELFIDDDKAARC